MLPKIEPLAICLRPGTPALATIDALYIAWANLSSAREVPFQAADPLRWLRAFHSHVRAALEAFERHSDEADAPDSYLAELVADDSLWESVTRQREDHGRLRRRLVELAEGTRHLATNALGQVVLANEEAAMLQLYLGLHHRRLSKLLGDRGLVTAAGVPVLALPGGRS